MITTSLKPLIIVIQFHYFYFSVKPLIQDIQVHSFFSSMKTIHLVFQDLLLASLPSKPISNFHSGVHGYFKS